MKKTILAIAAAVMLSTSVFAQGNAPEAKQDEKRPDATKMAKRRTEETVKQYGLNEEQAAQLLDLNTRFAGKMGPRRGFRPDGTRGGRGMSPDSMGQHRQHPKGEMKEGRPEGKDAPEMKERRAERKGNADMKEGRETFMKEMEAYEAELQKIMTKEQYEAYKADREKRMKNGPRGHRR